MYKASTFLTSIFRKFSVQDKWVRGRISWLYKDVITYILSDVPPPKQLIVFNFFLSSVESTISYLNLLSPIRKSPEQIPLIEQSLQILKCNIDFTIFLIKKVGLRPSSQDMFDSIMKQVNVDDIACDIGDCIREYRDAVDERTKTEIIQHMEVLLTDYNFVTGNFLKVSDLLNIPGVVESEL